MKPKPPVPAATLAMFAALAGIAAAQVTPPGYRNFIRQTQFPSGVVWDADVAAAGKESSSLPLDEAGARFDLWTVKESPFTSYLLDSKFIGTFAPGAELRIVSEDPYPYATRTRADRPFEVEISISGLNPDAPTESGRGVELLRHVQSYGIDGTGAGIDRSMAALLSRVIIDGNGTRLLSFPVNSVPGPDRAKVRGEERFTVFSFADEHAPASQLSSRTIQVWPVADAEIQGIEPGQIIRFKMPKLTLVYNDLYPESHTYAQIYQGPAALGTDGTRVVGSEVVLTHQGVPENRVLLLDDYDAIFGADGTWTIEIVTETPFGIERLAHRSFEIRRTLSIRGQLTTLE